MRKSVAILLSVLIIFLLSTETFADAKSSVLIDGRNGRILYAHNANEHLPMASTTKIMTAMLTLEQSGLDEYFTVNQSAIMVEGSSMGLAIGDSVTLRILAGGMLLSSGNDAANAAAVRVAGSVSAFVKLMNERAKELGLKDTSFETPSGLDGEHHYSTALDMASLARAALKNPEFAKICSQSSIKVSFGDPPYTRWLSNHNRLINTLKGATGVKTGFTKRAGRCLVSSAERDGVSLICVTLNCPDDWDHHTSLYNDFFAQLTDTELTALVPIVTVPVSGGNQSSVTLRPKPVSASLFVEEYENISVVISKEPFVFAPVNSEDVLGKAIFYLDGKIIAEASLTADFTVETAAMEKSFSDKIKEFFRRVR